MLYCDDLSFHYDRNDPGETPDFSFTFELAPGQCLSIQGPSGSGKSTLLNLLAGFLEPSGGTLAWNEESLLTEPPWERGMTTVFQEHNLFEHLPVWANIGFGLAANLRLNEAQREWIYQGLIDVGLGGLQDRLPGELSGGQRQRVALLRALLRQPRMLLLDEPFSGLDYVNREVLWGLVKRQQQEGVAVLLVSHDPEDIQALADRCYQLEEGRLSVPAR
ncbi:ATP-binding cassette domain-containing protein [Halomonas sp. PR-M31]|uniref:thiamine ABC transporter ATP-binding protein n=1 Tax=Halomonas sp. PR-M31 TaxID=1471202 RepID=UPI000650A23E|nr:ATP-binding cassette domain-containing protein [Halomonas sp. PR-M31]